MQEVLVSKIFNYTSTPTKNVEGQFWFNPSTNVLSRFNGTVWKPITVSSDDVAVLTDGSKVSLTNYLNTQIAALAEGIDSKQDQLSYYTENTTTNKSSFNIDGKSTGTSEFSINVTDSVGDNSGNSVINLTAGSVSNGAGKINLKASGSSGGKITLSTINGASIQNTGIELNVPFNPDHESSIGNNSGIIFNGPISGTGITKTITDVDYRLPTSKAVKTELDKKQGKLSNPGFLYLNNGYAISECKPTFSSAQSLVFTYKVSEDELDDAPWSIIGNIRVWDGKKGIGIAKQSKKGGNGLQCGFNWGYGQNGDTTSRNFVNATTAQFADGKPHTWALVCGKNATNGFLKLYRDGVLIDSKMTLALFDDFTPEYGFRLGKHQTSASNDNPAKGRISNVAFFNFDISDSTKTYTINDYHNGKSIPQSLITATEGERAIWVLDNYTRTNISSKKYIKDLAGNNDAIITNDIHDIIDGKVDDTLSTKQNKLTYYSEDITKSVSKLSSNRLEVNCYDESGNTDNPFILRNENGIAIGGSERYGGKGILTNIGEGYINLETPGGTTILNYDSLEIEGYGESTFKVLTYPLDSDFTSSKINVSAINSSTYDVLLSLKDDKVNISSATVGSITPSAFTSTNAQTLICADAFAIKPTTKTLFGFNNSAYNISTNRYAGLFYLKNTDANSTGISINPDNIILSDYNKYYSSYDEGTYFAATEIDKGRISLQKRTNGSSEFIDSGYINPDSIKLHNGKFGSAYDRPSDIIITSSRNSSDAPNFHGIAYKGADSTDTDVQWFIGRTVDGDNPFEGQPTVSKPYIKGFANAEFSETVKSNKFQIGEQVSPNTGMSYWEVSKLGFNTPSGYATYAYNGIEISNAFFKVVGGGSNPYVQIPDNNGSNFKIWKGTETEFKALTAVSSDTVYLRVQENNRIKATVGTDTASLENITDSYTLSSASFTSFITDTKYNNAQGSILITPSLTNSGALIFGENITDTSKGFPLYPDNIVSIPFKNITNFKVAGSINDSFNYIVSFDI